ncbi:MAG: PDZ domain-containing protein [Chloroflexi bacterium]|nr:PDZ domain-containing protein [Chloroflexota bacterium]
MLRVISKLIRLLAVLSLVLVAAVAFAQDDLETQSTEVPFLGIRYWGVDEGLLVTGVIANTPAEAAALQSGDVVTAVEGESIQVETVRDVVWKHAPGTTVTLSLDRDGAAMEQGLTLMARPDDLFENPLYAIPLDLPSLGLYVGQCDDKLVVFGALAGSDIASAGFQVYDQILTIDGDAVSNFGEADAAVSDLSEGDVLSFVVLRGDQELTVKTVVVDHRRRPPRHRRPYPRPRLEYTNTYVSDSIGLGYGDGFIEVQAIDPAHELYVAGIRRFDFITAANGAPLAEAKDYFAGDEIALTVARDNGALEFTVPATVAPLLLYGLDAPVEQDRSQWLGLHEKQVTLGVRYIQLEPDNAYFEGSGVSHGAYIAEVIEGLPAAKAGVQVGDVITAVAGDDVTMELDLRNRIYFHQPGDRVTLDILRAGEMMQIEVTLRVAS